MGKPVGVWTLQESRFEQVTSVAQLPTRNGFFRHIWTADSYVSSAVFEVWDAVKRASSAYGSFLYRYVKITGPRRWLIDLFDDMFTFGVFAAFALIAFALPSLPEGDVWNKGRQYAVTFTDSAGEVIGQRGIRQDDAIPLDDIPPHLIQAVLATEDARFFEHFGVDVIGTLRAAIRNAQGDGGVQGGSSITQQVAKNLFLSPERTIRRKVHEAFLSMWIEARLSKEEILKLYLDRSYLGGGTYGVEAAAQFYFGKSVRDISMPEAAILAGLFKAPTSYAPHQNATAAQARATVVLYRMLDAGFITQGELLEARRMPVQIIAKKDTDAPDWFLDWAYLDTLETMEANGLTDNYVIEVKTTIDRKLQRASQRILNTAIATRGLEEKFSQAASVTMAPDGAVRAIVGGRDYQESQFNRATSALRQTGSAFKPFVYLASMIKGRSPGDVVLDGPVSIGNWAPRNYNGSWHGRTTLLNALANSYNSVPVKLSIETGRKFIIETTHATGVKGDIDTFPSMVLGSSELTVLDITTGYATFAAGGKQAEAYAVLEIKKPSGEVIYNRATNATDPEQTIPEEAVANLNSMLSAVVKGGTATRADLGFAPQGGKTGTTSSYRDAWFIGFTAHHVTGVWVGNDDFSQMNEVTGGRVPAPIWKEVMDVAEAGLQPASLPGIPLDGQYTPIPVPENQVVAAATTPEEERVTPGQPAAEASSEELLNGMFAMFNDKPQKKVASGKKKKRRNGQQRRIASADAGSAQVEQQRQALVLPRANAGKTPRKSFLDSLFTKSRKKQQQKKKKPLFNF
jgi:penicillin-binding protein 1A